jgi:phosphodiesterase/alkaline phosphatase D-like protein
MMPEIKIVCGPIVRRTSPTSASLWVEVDQDCVLHARAVALRGPPAPRASRRKPPLAVSTASFTVKVGGRFYALLTLDDLAPGWVYAYALFYRPTLQTGTGTGNRAYTPRDPNAGAWWEADLGSFAIGGKRPTFRTFPVAKTEDIRVAFASCRTFGGGFFGGKGVYGEDVLPLFGQHLQKTVNDRLSAWPHLLLLLGDQIYADNVDRQVADARLRAPGRGGKVLGSVVAPESILDWERDRRPGEIKTLFRQKIFGKDVSLDIDDLQDYAGWGSFHCLDFEDFAALYMAAWAVPDVAHVLANVPTFMIFDDHEIANDWNLTGSWIKQVKRSAGWVKAITEGLVAYWMYQGWGNPPPPGKPDDRWKILEEAALNGTDALNKLQKWFDGRLALGRAAYYYEIAISPPVLVLDTRNDRRFVAPKQRGANNVVVHADFDDEILSEEQWDWLRSRIDQKGPLILACSVPLLQFLCADWWLLMGTRSENAFLRDYEEQDQDNADIFEYYRRHIGTDQWTGFPKSFVKLTKELFDRGPFIFLAGDVHYSYGMLGRTLFPDVCKLGRNPLILHAVSSPLRSQWTEEQVKSNDPEAYCHFSKPEHDRMTRNMRLAAERLLKESLKPGEPCDLSKFGSQLTRILLPDALPIFDGGQSKMKWTHLNNIGILHVAKDGKSVKVSWLGASTKKGEALREIGSIASRIGWFVR